MYQTEIKFKTTERKTKLTDGKVCYQGQLVHNHVLNVHETRQCFAEYMQLKEPQVNLYLDGLCSFMCEYLSKGYRLDFGGFSAELRMRGGFPAANAPFDPNRNTVGVDLLPGLRVKRAANVLKPVNVTFDEKERIYNILQLSPFQAYDVVARDGERLVEVTGTKMKVHAEADDEGIWIENDAGAKILRGDIQSCDCCSARFKLTEPVEPGLYWLAVCSRAPTGGPLLRFRRRLTVA